MRRSTPIQKQRGNWLEGEIRVLHPSLQVPTEVQEGFVPRSLNPSPTTPWEHNWLMPVGTFHRNSSTSQHSADLEPSSPIPGNREQIPCREHLRACERLSECVCVCTASLPSSLTCLSHSLSSSLPPCLSLFPLPLLPLHCTIAPERENTLLGYLG